MNEEKAKNKDGKKKQAFLEETLDELYDHIRKNSEEPVSEDFRDFLGKILSPSLTAHDFQQMYTNEKHNVEQLTTHKEKIISFFENKKMQIEEQFKRNKMNIDQHRKNAMSRGMTGLRLALNTVVNPVDGPSPQAVQSAVRGLLAFTGSFLSSIMGYFKSGVEGGKRHLEKRASIIKLNEDFEKMAALEKLDKNIKGTGNHEKNFQTDNSSVKFGVPPIMPKSPSP